MLRPSFVIAFIALLAAAGVSAAPPTTHYRSIGDAPDYTTGTVTAVNGETYVIGSLDVQWQTANRGRGDRVRIAGVDYTIFSVDAENELTLTEPFAEPTTFAAPYRILRKFKLLRDWEDCISNNGGCVGVSSLSLLTDQRIEVGVVYKDSPFLMNVGAERLQLNNVFTNVNYHITLTTTPANRHHGRRNTGVILDNGAQGSPAIDIQTGFVTIEWIELQLGDDTEQILVSGVGGSSQIIVHNVLFYDDDSTSHGFHVNDEDANVLFYNNILYGLNDGVRVSGLQTASNGWFEFYHNTFYQNLRGLHSTISPSVDNNVIVMNSNLAHSNAVDFDAQSPSPLSAKNWSGDSTGLTHFGVPGISLPTIQFVSETFPVDLHIKRGSIVVDQGAGPVSGDIDGRLRGGAPDIGADEADTSSANPVKLLTAKSAFELVQLEWQHPDFGPQAFVEVHRSPTAFPTQATAPTLACSWPAPFPGSKGQCTDTLPRINGTKYYYSAFLYDAGGNYSKEASVVAMPFDNGAVPPEWTYATNAATLEPAGVRGPSAFVVSNDRFFHAMQGGSGSTAGEWPLAGWAPYKLPAMVQHRPVIVDVSTRPTALLSAQDGRVYAVDIATGKLLWKSPVLGGTIDAAPAVLVGDYGATGDGADRVFVGTSDALSNRLYFLDLMTGDIVDWFDDGGNPANIGPVTGVAVKYPDGPVFFTSYDGSGGASNRNVWSIDVVGPSPPFQIWSDSPGPVESGPTLYNGMLFVGTQGGILYGYNDVGTSPLWNFVIGDGPIKSPIFPVWPNDTVIFTSDTQIHSVQVAATGGCGTAPCLGWSFALGAGQSSPLVIPGTNKVYVGLGNGDLNEVSLDLANPMNLPPAPRVFNLTGSSLGAVSFSVPQMMLYVSDSSGKVHGIPWPIP